MSRGALAVLLVFVAAAARADEAAALKKLEGLRAKVTRDEDKPGKPIVAVDLSGTAVTDNDLRGLTALESLTTLKLARTKVTDVGLKWVMRHVAIRSLDLEG